MTPAAPAPQPDKSSKYHLQWTVTNLRFLRVETLESSCTVADAPETNQTQYNHYSATQSRESRNVLLSWQVQSSLSSSYYISQHNIKQIIKIITVEYKNMPEGCQSSKRSFNWPPILLYKVYSPCTADNTAIQTVQHKMSRQTDRQKTRQ